MSAPSAVNVFSALIDRLHPPRRRALAGLRARQPEIAATPVQNEREPRVSQCRIASSASARVNPLRDSRSKRSRCAADAHLRTGL